MPKAAFYADGARQSCLQDIGELALEHHAETSWLGMGLSVATLSICPWLGRAKLRVGAELGS